MSKAYNQVIKDYAQVVNELMGDTMYAASRLHLMNAGRASGDDEEPIVFQHDELVESKDPRIRKIMQAYTKARETMTMLETYWLTTSEWANGEEL